MISQKFFSRSVRVLREERKENTLLVFAASNGMSYFSPSGKARLKVTRIYLIYWIELDSSGNAEKMEKLLSFNRKSEASKRFNEMRQELKSAEISENVIRIDFKQKKRVA